MSRFKKVRREDFKFGMIIRSEPAVSRTKYKVVDLEHSLARLPDKTYLLQEGGNLVIASDIQTGYIEQESIPLGKLPHGARFEFDWGIYMNGMTSGTLVKVNDKRFVLLPSGEWQEVKAGQENYQCYLIEESNS